VKDSVFTQIFEDIKHFVEEIDTRVLSLLHHVLKSFAYPTSHIVQQSVWLSIDSVALSVDDNVFLDSNLEVLVVLFMIMHVLLRMVSLRKLVDLAFFVLRFWVLPWFKSCVVILAFKKVLSP